jgi:aminoglycoside 3-N-acetyltransferase
MDLKTALTDLSLRKRLVLVHASDAVDANELLTALLDSTGGFITPAFTPKCLLPLDFHPSGKDTNIKAEPFASNMPTDEVFGAFPELVRNHPKANRSAHPVLSFAGISAENILNTQTTHEPYAPIASLAEQDGVVLLVGFDQRVNFSIHYGEKLAGRMQFIRYALTKSGLVECPNFPGDSEGFNAIEPDLKSFTRRANIGDMEIQAIPINQLLQTVVNKLHEDPYALLCSRPDCERCEAVRWG